jgi:hypothetical protein
MGINMKNIKQMLTDFLKEFRFFQGVALVKIIRELKNNAIKKIMKIFLLAIITLPSICAFATELIRLDTPQVEKLSSHFSVAVFITENCSICDHQIRIIQKCFDPKQAAFFMEGNEERLRRIVRKKKIKFPTYYLDKIYKEKFLFGTKSPALSIKSAERFELIEGLQDCEQIKSRIKDSI